MRKECKCVKVKVIFSSKFFHQTFILLLRIKQWQGNRLNALIKGCYKANVGWSLFIWHCICLYKRNYSFKPNIQFSNGNTHNHSFCKPNSVVWKWCHPGYLIWLFWAAHMWVPQNAALYDILSLGWGRSGLQSDIRKPLRITLH